MFMGLPNFCIRFRKDMILSDGVIFVASRTRFGFAQAGRAEKGAPQHLLVSEPRFRRFYKMISKLFVNDFKFFYYFITCISFAHKG